jgi:hexosaminidase
MVYENHDLKHVPGVAVELSTLDPPDMALGAEGYRLTVDDRIHLAANNAEGIFWGSRTLLQILEKGPGQGVYRLKIQDSPAYGYRGIMIDAARNHHSVDFHLEMVRRMASYKLNHYMLHFSDNESYTLPSTVYPDLPTDSMHYTRKEIELLVETAGRYHVTIVPSIDVPGHAAALVRGIPELGFGPNPKAIDIARDETYQILSVLFDEVIGLFPGKYWHLGADEIKFPDIGESPDQAYRNWMKEKKIKTGGQLLNYFINRMHEYVQSRDKEMLVWEGFDPDLEPKVHTEIIVCPFDVKHGGRMPGDYIQAGYRLLNTSWSPLYIANKIYLTTPEIMALWTPYMFGAGRSPQPFRYWTKLTPEDVSTEIIGAQMCSWGNEEKAEWGMFFGDMPGYPDYARPAPRAQIFSERVWDGGKTATKDLLERVGSAYW